MRYIKIKTLTLLLCIFGAPVALAQGLTVVVVDQHGKPLADAVVEVTNPPAAVADIERVYTMDQLDKAFIPKVLIVPLGALVTFPNSDNIRHHVYSFSKAKKFELKLYAGKPEAPVQFSDSGVVVLGCNIHDAMVGYIYVSSSSYVYLTDAQGVVNIPLAVADIASLQVWHADAAAGPDARLVVSVTAEQIAPLQVEVQAIKPAPRDTFTELYNYAQ